MTRVLKLLITTVAAGLVAACGPPASKPIDEVLKDLDPYYGRAITIKTKLRSGARCRIGEKGDFKTYCKDCQYCRGPYVVEVSGARPNSESDWPMIMGGTWELGDIRCKGPLGQIECHPFELGKTYVIRGVLERHKPPKLLVSKFWKIDG